jgi:DNA-binding FadR family transcriptional regulator
MKRKGKHRIIIMMLTASMYLSGLPVMDAYAATTQEKLEQAQKQVTITHKDVKDLGVLMKPLFQLVEFSEMNIDAIYTAREYIEGGIAVLAARNRTEEDLSMLKTHLENIQYCSQQGDLEGCYQCDVAFHMTLAKAARNPILLAAMEALQDIDDACVKRYDKYLVGYDDSRKEHGDILDAVEKQDFVKAQEAMAAHAKNSKIILLG